MALNPATASNTINEMRTLMKSRQQGVKLIMTKVWDSTSYFSTSCVEREDLSEAMIGI